MNWIERLKQKWGVTTAQVIVILIVFACTGFTVLFLKQPILSLIIGEGEPSIWFTIGYYVCILPIYNIILLLYGFVFGQFKFFFEFEKRMINKIFGNKKADQ